MKSQNSLIELSQIFIVDLLIYISQIWIRSLVFKCGSYNYAISVIVTSEYKKKILSDATEKQLSSILSVESDLPLRGFIINSGAPNDGFLLNALKTLFWLSKVLLDLLEKHSKRRCKICICSVILGELESIRNYKGLRIIFPKILDEIWRITKVRHSLIPLSTTLLNPKIVGFLSFYKK